MKEFDILGGQNILWPLLRIFRGSGPPAPKIYAPTAHQAYSNNTPLSKDCRFKFLFALSPVNLTDYRGLHVPYRQGYWSTRVFSTRVVAAVDVVADGRRRREVVKSVDNKDRLSHPICLPGSFHARRHGKEWTPRRAWHWHSISNAWRHRGPLNSIFNWKYSHQSYLW